MTATVTGGTRAAHEARAVPGTEESWLGIPAELDNGYHYPVEAECGCGERVIMARPGARWVHASDYYYGTAP